MSTESRDWVTQWFDNLRQRGRSWTKETREAVGVCDIITGPRKMYASIRMSVGPGDTLTVISMLDEDIQHRMEREGFLDYIVYGVLDVLLIEAAIPCTSFTLTLFEVDIHEIHTSPMAFRCAARDAARKLIGK